MEAANDIPKELFTFLGAMPRQGPESEVVKRRESSLADLVSAEMRIDESAVLPACSLSNFFGLNWMRVASEPV